MVRIPTHRPPTHPGEVLTEDYLKPLGMTQVQLAERIRVPFQRVNTIVKGHRGITPDTALRLAKLFGTTPDFWLNLQQAWDLYEALHAKDAADVLETIKPVAASA
jgi:antitoxin HigA-1